MFYAILTNVGTTPFQVPKKPSAAPGDPLRLSNKGSLLCFENQPDRLFAGKYARASGKVLWFVEKEILNRDDLPADETFSSCHDFQVWLSRRDNG